MSVHACTLGGDTRSVGPGTLKSEKSHNTLQTEQTEHTNAQPQAQFARVPSDKSAQSRWSAIKGSIKEGSLSDLKADNAITRAPSDKSAQSRWSLVKSQVGRGGEASLAGKTNQTGEFGRVPSNASQAKSAKSHWSDVKSRFSVGRSLSLPPPASSSLPTSHPAQRRARCWPLSCIYLRMCTIERLPARSEHRRVRCHDS